MGKERNRLRGRIIERYGSQKAFAEAIGLSEQAVSQRLNSRTGFSAKMIVKWSEALGIDTADIGTFFYASEFQNGKAEA